MLLVEYWLQVARCLVYSWLLLACNWLEGYPLVARSRLRLLCNCLSMGYLRADQISCSSTGPHLTCSSRTSVCLLYHDCALSTLLIRYRLAFAWVSNAIRIKHDPDRFQIVNRSAPLLATQRDTLLLVNIYAVPFDYFKFKIRTDWIS